MKIYVDLDGVLADFETGFKQKYGKPVSSVPDAELGKKYKTGFAKDKFFLNLPLFPGSKQFINKLKDDHDIEFLTAVSEYDSKENAKQKKIWANKHFPGVPFNWVNKSHEKYKFAKPGVLLIDDREKSTKPFARAGGKTILHTKFNKTLERLKTMSETTMKTFSEFLLLSEVAIQFGKKAYPKFGQVVILAGGAGSGKGFVSDNLLSIEGKTFDVDEIKKLSMASTMFAAKVKEETGVDLKKINLKNSKDVGILHNIVGDLYKLDKKILNTSNKSVLLAHPDRKPNLIFDVTLKDMAKLDTITANLEGLGYKKEDVHIVWIMNKFDVAVDQNQNRARVVPEEIMFASHEGASLTFAKILSMGSKLKKYMNGDIFIAFNQVKVDSDLAKSKRGGQYVTDANYIQVKEKGKSQTPLNKLDKRVVDKIRDYVPKTITWG